MVYKRTCNSEWGRRTSLLWLLILFCCAGCTTQTQTAVQATPSLAQATASAPTGATISQNEPWPTGVATPTGTFQNPVFRRDFPDPDIIAVDGTYYAYATNAASAHIQVARSTDLVSWQLLADALPTLPSWAQADGYFVWAPEVIQLDDRFVLYYTARDKQADKQCIGVATSDKPDGVFRDTNAQPLVCQSDEGGSIDPSPLRDGDTLYLYWKNDGNCCGKATYIYAQQLAPDGLRLMGEPTRLVTNDAFWEGSLIEAPTMVKHDNSYVLFFSANAYDGPQYGVGYATCQSATGPCTDAKENPILNSRMMTRPNVVGPGHQTIVQVGDTTWIAYHAWEITDKGQRGNRRFMWLDRVEWQDGKPHVDGPTTGPQPRPIP